MRKPAAGVFLWMGPSLLAALAGCTTGKTDAGTDYSFRLTTLSAGLDYPVEEVHKAALAAMTEDFRLTVSEAGLDGFEGRVLAVGATGKTHRISVEKAGPKYTRIKIYVGPRGDDARSRQILARIEERLKGG